MSCDGCVSAPAGAVDGQQDTVTKQQDKVGKRQDTQQDTVGKQQDTINKRQDKQQDMVDSQHDMVGKATTVASGRRAIVRPQWKTPAAAAVDQVQAAQKEDGVVKAQQEPRGVVMPPQVQAHAVNGETLSSFHARRSNGGKSNEVSADQVQAALTQSQDHMQHVREPHRAVVADQAMDAHMIMNPIEHAAYLQGKQASQQVHRSSMPGQVNAALGIQGQFPRPSTDQRQIRDQQQIQDSVADTPTIMKAPRGTHLSGGPIEGMGPAVLIVDSRQ